MTNGTSPCPLNCSGCMFRRSSVTLPKISYGNLFSGPCTNDKRRDADETISLLSSSVNVC